jgi:hypothetical protein
VGHERELELRGIAVVRHAFPFGYWLRLSATQWQAFCERLPNVSADSVGRVCDEGLFAALGDTAFARCDAYLDRTGARACTVTSVARVRRSARLGS